MSYNSPLWLINARRVGNIPCQFKAKAKYFTYYLIKAVQMTLDKSKGLLPAGNQALKVNFALIYEGSNITGGLL